MSFASLCLLSYNRLPFLTDAIESLHHSGYPFELIVHDDGSDDPNIRDCLVDWLHDGTVSTVIANPRGHNEGVGTAVNRMFSIAKGDPLVKIDQDLIFTEGWLARVVEILDRNSKDFAPTIGALGGFRYFHPPVQYEEEYVSHHGYFEVCRDFVGSMFAVPRRVWEHHRPFPEGSPAFAEDVEFKHRLQSHDYVMALPPEDLVVNRGFGIGPSTVVVGDGEVCPIHKEPLIHAR